MDHLAHYMYTHLLHYMYAHLVHYIRLRQSTFGQRNNNLVEVTNYYQHIIAAIIEKLNSITHNKYILN